MTHVLRVAALLAALVLVLAACGGAASPSASTAASSPSASAAESAEASAAPSGEESIAPIPSLDLSAAAEALAGINSYRIRMTIQGASPATVEGVIIRQPESAEDITITAGNESQHIVVVGDKAWVDVGGSGTFVPLPASAVAGMTRAFDPVLLASGYNAPGVVSALQTVGRENKNGVDTTHYQLKGSDPAGQLASLPPDAVIDVWVADEGYLVSLAAASVGSLDALTMDVTNINDPANVVEPPMP